MKINNNKIFRGFSINELISLFKYKNKFIYIIRLLILTSVFVLFINWRIAASSLGNSFDIFSLGNPKLYSPFIDNNFFSFFENNLIIWCIILNLIAIKKNNFKGVNLIPLIFFMLYITNVLDLHEGIGRRVLNISYTELTAYDLPFLRAQCLLELLYWFIFIFLIIIMNLYNKKTDEPSQKFLRCNFYFFFLLGFFGIFLDIINGTLININLINNNIFYKILAFSIYSIEEFGEICTFMFAFLWLLDFVSTKDYFGYEKTTSSIKVDGKPP